MTTIGARRDVANINVGARRQDGAGVPARTD
jgi:hypothetical protein